jgi:TRAP-type C4-dicarboxylate transport system substrate-binding protein
VDRVQGDADKSAPGEFDVQINLNGSLFKQGTEPAAMARGNLELAAISAQDIAKILPEYSIFTAGYLIRDPDHQQKVFNGPIGTEMYKAVSEKMDVQILGIGYLGAARSTCAKRATCARRPTSRASSCACPAPRNGCSWAKRWAPRRRRWPLARSTWA